ncbi:MAG: hypothetical protein MK289_20620, partial [Trichodesmium sp. ALOHA_ZT_67]|nr:hypothetical protein [Trichodesmium sp. ALOHA_ZT_67]
SPLRDYIFQEFMAGRKGLAVRMPEELREELRRKYSQKVGWWFWFQWVWQIVGLQEQVKRGLWFQWVWANSVGWFVGLFVFGVWGGVVENTMGGLGPAVFGTVFGAVVGSFQWWVIRKRLSQARWWILATALASALLLPTAAVLLNDVSDVVSNTLIQGVVISSVMGLVIGSAQWLVLSKQISQSHWWILANILGISGVEAVLVFVIYTVTVGDTVGNTAGNVIMIFSIFGVIYGVINGITLVWLLRQPGNSVINNKK